MLEIFRIRVERGEVINEEPEQKRQQNQSPAESFQEAVSQGQGVIVVQGCCTRSTVLLTC